MLTVSETLTVSKTETVSLILLAIPSSNSSQESIPARTTNIIKIEC